MTLVVIEAFGKRTAYESAFAAALGGRVEAFATGCHFCAYPYSLRSLDCRLARDPAGGEVVLDEHARVANSDVAGRLARATALPPDGRVYNAKNAVRKVKRSPAAISQTTSAGQVEVSQQLASQ